MKDIMFNNIKTDCNSSASKTMQDDEQEAETTNEERDDVEES
jgi:hypothetical protein